MACFTLALLSRLLVFTPTSCKKEDVSGIGPAEQRPTRMYASGKGAPLFTPGMRGRADRRLSTPAPSPIAGERLIIRRTGDEYAGHYVERDRGK